MYVRAAFLALIFAALFSVQAQPPLAVAWQAAVDLPGVDFSPLSASQKQAALKLMRDMDCTCACGRKIAQCRVEDSGCGYSKGIAAQVVKGFSEGKSPEEVIEMVAASPLGHQRPQPKVLEDPISIQTAGSPTQGPPGARVTFVEFSDFECPYCAKAASEIRNIMAAYPKDIRLVYKQFPLSMHPHAEIAALASLAAQDQGKFWEMHDKLFSNFHGLNRDRILNWAQEMKMDMPKFTAGLDSPKNKAIVEKDLKDGEFAGVTGTPALYINGQHFNGPISLSVLKPFLDDKVKKTQASARPQKRD